jgi:hypothetical protein
VVGDVDVTGIDRHEFVDHLLFLSRQGIAAVLPPRLGRSARQFQAPARIDTISRPGGLEEVCSQKRSSWGDRGFESPFLQRRVHCETDFCRQSPAQGLKFAKVPMPDAAAAAGTGFSAGSCKDPPGFRGGVKNPCGSAPRVRSRSSPFILPQSAECGDLAGAMPCGHSRFTATAGNISWNAPLDDPEHADNAMRAALAPCAARRPALRPEC